MIIGLEVHIYPHTKSKMYCSCDTDFIDHEPNTNICPICTGQPGSKPMGINKRAVEIGVMIAQALGCKIVTEHVVTQRKHYFYPDLPNNYQRTSKPFAVKGNFKGVNIWEIHWEEDPGQYELKKGEVDYNRSGMPLLEMVTAPDMKSPQEAYEFLKDLRLMLDYMEVMRPGTSFKCDANISVEGSERIEVKNLNSIKAVEDSLAYEARTLPELVKQGVKIKRVTKHYDELFDRTITLREKETTQDYRYMKDPDIPCVILTSEWVGKIKAALPENPFEIIKRMVSQFGISNDAARAIVSDRKMYESYSRVIGSTEKKIAADFYVRDIKGELNYRSMEFAKSNLTDRAITDLIKAISCDRVTRLLARDMLRMVLDGRYDERKLTAELECGFDESAIETAVDEVIAKETATVEKYKSGKTEVLNFLLGMVLKKIKKKGDPKVITRLLKSKLDN